MGVDLTDLCLWQLGQQASLYNLGSMKGRAKSAAKLAAFYLQLLEPLQIDITVEIGAHEASFSRQAKALLPALQARAYEANPNVYSHFLLAGAMSQAGVEYRHLAIGNADGEADFYIYERIKGEKEPDDGRRHSCLKRIDSQGASYLTLRVPAARLDSLCRTDDPQSRYALWIDAEGMGMPVLAGAQAMLGRVSAIYIEVESAAKFAGQALDKEITAFLLERGFMPLARDFQFPRQYNLIFVQKGQLAAVEPQWHRYLGRSLREEMARTFGIRAVSRQSAPQAPAPLKKMRFASVAEMREAMAQLPLLRQLATNLSSGTVVACHARDLEEAIAFYGKERRRLPEFYVMEMQAGVEYLCGARIRPLADIEPGMDARIFFRRVKMPDQSGFISLTNALRKLGIESFSIERFCASEFWRRKIPEGYSQGDAETILNFFNLLKDAHSQYTYLAICQANLTGEAGYIPIAPYGQYYHPLVHVEAGDIVCEGGLDITRSPDKTISTTMNFYSELGERGQLYGFEPVAATCSLLQELIKNLPRIRVENKALWRGTGQIGLHGDGRSNCAFTQAAGNENILCVSMDEYFHNLERPTLVKLDIEGAERMALAGASELITAAHPKLMVAIYHKRNGPDWIAIPEMLMTSSMSGYDYYCGHHRPWFAESFVYARRMA